MPPTVTVITPVFNALQTLERTVASVRGQDFADWELLLSDDGSTDGSVALADRLAAEDPRIRVLRCETNGGAARARNRALDAARGRYIAFLDSDDEWVPHKLSRQIGFMQDTGAAFTYAGFWRVRDGRTRQVVVPDSVSHAQLLNGNVIGCLTAVYDSDALGRVPMPDLRMRQDYGLWLRLLRRTDRAVAVPEPLGWYHVRSSSLSAGKLAATRATWRLYRDVEELSRLRAARCLFRHLSRRLLN